LVADGEGEVKLTEALFAEGTVVADLLDVEETPVGREAARLMACACGGRRHGLALAPAVAVGIDGVDANMAGESVDEGDDAVQSQSAKRRL
jgi:hypothetical protein